MVLKIILSALLLPLAFPNPWNIYGAWPLAWIALEANRTVHHHELTAQVWPGGAGRVQLGTAHAHGAWLAWLETPVGSVWPD